MERESVEFNTHLRRAALAFNRHMKIFFKSKHSRRSSEFYNLAVYEGYDVALAAMNEGGARFNARQ